VAEPPASRVPDPLAWLFGPAVPLSPSPTATPPPLSRLPPPEPAEPQTLQPAAPEEPPDSLVAAAQRTAKARRGLGPQRALYARVVATRKLLHVWDQIGKYVESPKRRLSRSAEGPELSRLLGEMRTHLRRFPRLMGAAGQPGYLAVVLAKQEHAARSFQALD